MRASSICLRDNGMTVKPAAHISTTSSSIAAEIDEAFPP
jgi:hypothetical protein